MIPATSIHITPEHTGARLAMMSACARPLPAVLLPLAARGGGSDSPSEPAVTDAAAFAPGEFSVNPGASWLQTRIAGDRRNGAVASVALRRVNGDQTLPAGSVLKLQALGSYIYNAAGSAAANVSAVFVDDAGRYLDVGAGSEVQAATTPSTCDPAVAALEFAGDFIIPTDAARTAIVPAGATSLQLSVDDCYFADNISSSSDPLRVKIDLGK